MRNKKDQRVLVPAVLFGRSEAPEKTEKIDIKNNIFKRVRKQ